MTADDAFVICEPVELYHPELGDTVYKMSAVVRRSVDGRPNRMASNSPAKTLLVLFGLTLGLGCSKTLELTPVKESVTLTSEPGQGVVGATVKWGDVLTGARKGSHWKVKIDAATGFAAAHELQPYPIAGETMYVTKLGNTYSFEQYKLGTKLQVTRIDSRQMGVVKDGVVIEAIDATLVSAKPPDAGDYVRFAQDQLQQDQRKGIPAARAFIDAALALDPNHEGAKTWGAALAAKKAADNGALYLRIADELFEHERSAVAQVKAGETAVVWAPRAQVAGAGELYVGRVVHVVEVDLDNDTARIQWDPDMPRILSLSEYSGSQARAAQELPESPAEGSIALHALGPALPHVRALVELAAEATQDKEATRLLLVAAAIDRDEDVMSSLLAAAIGAGLPDVAMWTLVTEEIGIVPPVEELALVFGCDGEPATSPCLSRIEADYPCEPCQHMPEFSEGDPCDGTTSEEECEAATEEVEAYNAQAQEEFDAMVAEIEEAKAHHEQVVEEARANYPGSRYLILTVRNTRSKTIERARVAVVETSYRMPEGCGSGGSGVTEEKSAWDLRLGPMGAGEVVKVWVPVASDENVQYRAGNETLNRKPGSPDGGPDCTCDCSRYR